MKIFVSDFFIDATWFVPAIYYGLLVAAIAAILSAVPLLRRRYFTSWYDPSKDGFFAPIDWPEVRRLMDEPLSASVDFRLRLNLQLAQDLAVACLAILGWVTAVSGYMAFVQRPSALRLDVAVFAFGIPSLAASLLGISYQWRVKARSENRQEWIREIRAVLTELIACLPNEKDLRSPKKKAECHSKYFVPHSKLELLLNPTEKAHRAMLTILRRAYGFDPLSIDDIPIRELGISAQRPLTQLQLNELKSQIIRLANVILKREWEQVKYAR